MASLTKEHILNALTHVRDTQSANPKGEALDVVSAGLIQGLVIKDGHVGFSVEVDPRDGAAKEPLRKACEEAAYGVPGVLSVTAVLTAHSQQSAASTPPPQPAPQPARPGLSRKASADATPKAALSTEPLPGITHTIAVASGKGGVGKSTVAINLAIGLAKLGKRVGLLDADIYGPSVPRLMGLKGTPESDGKRLKPMEAWGLKTMSIGFMVDEDTPMIWRGPMVMSALTQMMRDVEWGELDVLVVDMPPGTGDAQLTLVQRVALAGAIIVSTPQDLALIDARKGLAMFTKTRVPILGMIENMSYFISPESGEKTFIFGEGGVRRTAEELGCDFLGEIPLLPKIRETSDSGEPITASAPDSAEAKIFLDLAAKVAIKLSAAKS